MPRSGHNVSIRLPQSVHGAPPRLSNAAPHLHFVTRRKPLQTINRQDRTTIMHRLESYKPSLTSVPRPNNWVIHFCLDWPHRTNIEVDTDRSRALHRTQQQPNLGYNDEDNQATTKHGPCYPPCICWNGLCHASQSTAIQAHTTKWGSG